MKEFFDFPSSKISWFHCGGDISVFCVVDNLGELRDVYLKYIRSGLQKKFVVVGAGSNILFKDAGFDGLVVKLAGEFFSLKVDGDKVIAGGCVLSKQISSFALENGLIGAEFLSTIPGSVGGMVKMNAGCFGNEIKDIFYSANVFVDGEIKTLTRDGVNFDYRQSSISNETIILSVCLLLKKVNENNDIEASKIKIKEMNNYRKQNQVIGFTCGSTFANPVDKNGKKISVWKLIDEVGLRGYKIGGAMFSEKHCNFIVNDGSATATDIENLIDLAKKRVQDRFGIKLRLEIKVI